MNRISLLLLRIYFAKTAEENAPVEKTFSSSAVFLRVKAGKAIMLRTHVWAQERTKIHCLQGELWEQHCNRSFSGELLEKQGRRSRSFLQAHFLLVFLRNFLQKKQCIISFHPTYFFLKWMIANPKLYENNKVYNKQYAINRQNTFAYFWMKIYLHDKLRDNNAEKER